MKNAEILSIIHEEVNATASLMNEEFKSIETFQHRNGYCLSVRVGHRRFYNNVLSNTIEYSHPGYTCTVYGILGEEKIRAKLREYLSRF